ncbi:hypothetical protein NCER_101821 [Vairimorpha ceranae BRL01]|uniref:Uncharacterized protein n=2 Tax=Vairimorpha ceranae TaxID=40302 RepID=C4VAU4_VAIC1|nr:hypothetical protein AAJ76_6700013465 [Vairimorpha ceranae]EEQ81657.1 hypothetical protein NCER_101821 [Vairimorpha ceranae BRL01]KAF5140392.1 hypothetical protein G9O61_00g015000 [Vairimorpha ceranae]KKO74478.1 hypothetical protein AAJ76_6700013465 [Vairimorpha ceranae]
MLIDKNRSLSLFIVFGCFLYIFILLLFTECIYDTSIMNYKLIFTGIIAVSFFVPICHIIIGYKYSVRISLLFASIIMSASILQIFYRKSVGFYFIDKSEAISLLQANKNSTKDINTHCSKWTSLNTVVVLFYSDKDVKLPDIASTIVEEDFENYKNYLIVKIQYLGSKRKTVDDVIFVSEEFKKLNIKSLGDLKLLAQMLNSIRYSELPKNTVILLKVDNFKDFTVCGFNRSIQK